MKHSLLLSLTLVLFSCQFALGQPDNPSRYFPQNIGDSWTYFTLLDPPNQPVDTTLHGPFTVVDSISIEDYTYLLFDQSPLFPTDTIRVDTEGRVWTYTSGKEALLFDFTISSDSVYHFEQFGVTFDVHLTTDLDVETHIGGFNQCAQFDIVLPQAVDADRTYIFCPDVGLVEHIGGMGEVFWLFAATVNGLTVTHSEVPDQLDQEMALVNYPNPFSGQTSFSFSMPAPGLAQLRIYDLQGRLIDTVINAEISDGPHEVIWRPGGLASGPYLYVLDIRESRQAQLLHVR